MSDQIDQNAAEALVAQLEEFLKTRTPKPYRLPPEDKLRLLYDNRPPGQVDPAVGRRHEVVRSPAGVTDAILTGVAPVTQVVSFADTTFGAGDSTWGYLMGSEFQVTPGAQLPAYIRRVALKVGSGLVARNWQLRRSTATGSTVPALTTYTQVVASGTITPSQTGQWATAAISPGLLLSEGEWYVLYFYVGVGGQSASLTTARANNSLDERTLRVNAGVYVFVGTGILPGPASFIPPTTRVTTSAYGVVSVETGPEP